MQTGGLLIVTAGGENVLLSFKQKSPGDHVANDVILNALGITTAATEQTGIAVGETKEAGEMKGGDEVVESVVKTTEPEKVGDEGEKANQYCGAHGDGDCKG